MRRLYDRYLVGKVIKGKQLGRTLGFPTANLSMPEELKLASGVYGVYVYHFLKKYMGIMNIGTRPTFNDGHHKSLEVHLLNFDGCLYEQNLSVEVMFYIRDEKKFNTVEELKKHIQSDITLARERFKLNLERIARRSVSG